MTYSIKEIFYTLQGEGAHAGRPAVFCRFAGCNLWSGREADRATATCKFCDTDFVGTDGTDGGKYRSADELADKILDLWPKQPPSHKLRRVSHSSVESPEEEWDARLRGHDGEDKLKFVVLTGGEPLLQVDKPLIDALHRRGFMIAVETNGTLTPPDGIDWICVSPKAGAEWNLKRGHELKFVVPQEGLNPLDHAHLDFRRFSVQPMDGAERERNTRDAIAFCMRHPQWQLSLQTHKMTGIR